MTDRSLVDVEINVKIKLSALWAALVLLYIYADYFGLYIPEHIDDIMADKISGMPITQELLLIFMIFMVIPSLMVFLSLTLKPNVNRWVNIIVGLLQAGLVLPSVLDPYIFFVVASSIEAVLLGLIVWYAYKWPTQEG